jgi:hypothetical protein
MRAKENDLWVRSENETQDGSALTEFNATSIADPKSIPPYLTHFSGSDIVVTFMFRCD